MAGKAASRMACRKFGERDGGSRADDLDVIAQHATGRRPRPPRTARAGRRSSSRKLSATREGSAHRPRCGTARRAPGPDPSRTPVAEHHVDAARCCSGWRSGDLRVHLGSMRGEPVVDRGALLGRHAHQPAARRDCRAGRDPHLGSVGARSGADAQAPRVPYPIRSRSAHSPWPATYANSCRKSVGAGTMPSW